MANSQNPAFSVLIPVRNEQQYLATCIKSLKQAAEQAKTCIEIIVIINRSEDRSEEIAQEMGCIITHDQSKNLSLIRNAGAKVARGEIILTIDADNLASENIFSEILKTLDTGGYIGGGAWIIPERWSTGIFVSFLGLLPFLLFWRISVGAFYCHKKDFDAIGGFNPEYFSAEDVEFARRLKRYGRTQGKKYVLFPSCHIITSCRKFDRFGDWYFIRNGLKMLKLLGGGKSQEADEIWYDFKN